MDMINLVLLLIIVVLSIGLFKRNSERPWYNVNDPKLLEYVSAEICDRANLIDHSELNYPECMALAKTAILAVRNYPAYKKLQLGG